MSDFVKKTIRSLIVGLVISGLVGLLRGLFSASGVQEIFSGLCDAFFVTSVLIGGLGILTWVRNQGAFDALTFSIHRTISLKWSRGDNFKEEYRDWQEKKRAKRSPVAHWLVAGAVYLALSLAALAVYNMFG